MKFRRFAIAASILVALIGFVGILTIVQATLKQVDVVEAVTEIAPGTKLSAQNVRVVKIHQQALHPQAARRMADVEGQYAMTTLYPGEQVLKGRLSGQSISQSSYPQLRPDQRAVAVPVTLVTSIGGTVKAGAYVDLVAFKESDRTAGTLLTRVLVLDVRGASGASLNGPKNFIQSNIANTASEVPAAVILAVSADQVPVVVQAVQTGTITLVLNPSGE